MFDEAVKATAKSYEALEEREGKELSAQIEGTVSVLWREDMVGQFVNPLYGIITIARVIPHKDERKEEEEEGLEYRYNEHRSKMEHYHYETFKTVLEDLGVAEARLVGFEAGMMDMLRNWVSISRILIWFGLSKSRLLSPPISSRKRSSSGSSGVL